MADMMREAKKKALEELIKKMRGLESSAEDPFAEEETEDEELEDLAMEDSGIIDPTEDLAEEGDVEDEEMALEDAEEMAERSDFMKGKNVNPLNRGKTKMVIMAMKQGGNKSFPPKKKMGL